MALDPALQALAEHFGVATDYYDWHGQLREVPHSTLTAVLTALGNDVSTPEAAERARDEAEHATWRRMLPPCVVTRSRVERTFPVHIPDGNEVTVTVVTETGDEVTCTQRDHWVPPREIDGTRIGEATFAVPEGLPFGYHRLVAVSGEHRAETPLIITPDWLGTPEAMGADPVWGLIAQLYSVRSAQSWGMGDAADLRELAAWSATEHDADFVLINPMHAAQPFPPVEPSPYLPTTRRFLNPLYIRVEEVAEYADLDEEDRAEIADARHSVPPDEDRIYREMVWQAKETALRAVFARPRSPERQADFDAYRDREGQDLVGFSTWCAIAAEHGSDWTTWPDELQSPDSPAVAAYLADHGAEADYHAWLQWVLDEQLQRAQTAATEAGMKLGVVHDLAVGVNPTGAEAWARGDVFARGVSVGAPPDAFTHRGQDWGQPPWRPDRLAELAYAPFRSMVAALLRHAGGIRVDHIIGLFRLWWIPQGEPPSEGTYVRYDHEALIGILALEAWRAGAVIIGEDLGTVEPWVRDYLAERGLLGTSILWWERDHHGDGLPLEPEEWREYCLASVTTHDLPPAAGYLEHAHVELRHTLGLIGDDLSEELAADKAEQADWRAALERRGYLDAGETDTEQTVLALHRYLAHTRSRMRGVALVDAVGDRKIQNQPGTIDEYPNWRVPLSRPDGQPLLLDEVFLSPRFEAIAKAVRGLG
ncbi:4-alpha-glucanotransferase [Enemella sp. A6]|uniref:4-alpha-glucanotransferase n=1 Tax=Enemella sp. A6 TaxID=3440152 RepID=UPI003EBCCD2F